MQRSVDNRAAESVLLEALESVCSALKDGLVCLRSGEFDRLPAHSELQAAACRQLQHAMRQPGVKLTVSVAAHLRELSRLSLEYSSYLRRFRKSIEVKQGLLRCASAETSRASALEGRQNTLSLEV